jgi:hypothetical protein
MKKAITLHTLEEINELKLWFDNHQTNLPATMQIEKGCYTPDLASTIDMLFDQAYICFENSKMQGCILLLEKIKKNLAENQ